MWTGLRIHYPIVEGRRREKRGREEGEWRKMGRAKLEGGETRPNSARAAPKGGGGGARDGRQKFTMRIILKGTRNIQTRLAHLNYFFGFVLADFTLLTWNSKKKNVNIFLYIPKQKSAYIVQGAFKKCLEMYDYIPISLIIFRMRTPKFPLFSLVSIV